MPAPLVGAALVTGGANLLSGFFGGLGASARNRRQRDFDVRQQDRRFAFTGEQNELNRNLQSRLGFAGFDLQRELAGANRAQQQGFFDVRRGQVGDINRSLLGQIGGFQTQLGSQSISQDAQNVFVQNQLAAGRSGRQRTSGIAQRLLGLKSPAFSKFNIAQEGNIEARLRSDIGRQNIAQTFQQDQQLRSLIANLLGGQRTV